MIVTDPRPDALYTWDEATDEDRAEHREQCQYGCGWCDGARQWGLCSGCYHADAEAIHGVTTCCDQRVLFGDEADRAWAA